MEKKKIDSIETLKEGVLLGVKNYPSLIVAAILYILTIWVPYINVGTTIAIKSLALPLSRGEIINPFEIFDAKYRKNMGNALLLWAFMFLGIVLAALFLIIPAFVLAMSWSLALLILIDNGISATEALTKSNEITYGNKWRMFFVYLIYGVAIWIVMFLLGLVFHKWETLNMIVTIILATAVMPMQLGIEALIYKQLK